jgi:hypothetical protein
LFGDRDRSITGGVDLTFDETRAGGVFITVAQTDDLHLGRIRPEAAKHELEPFAVFNTETVAVTGEVR